MNRSLAVLGMFSVFAGTWMLVTLAVYPRPRFVELTRAEMCATSGGLCYESPLLDVACPDQSVINYCDETLCVDSGAGYQCPPDTKGSHYWYQAYSSDCSVGEFGYDDCVGFNFRCEQWVNCFDCQTVTIEGVSQLVCKPQLSFGGTPITQDYVPITFGCTTY